jgi:hypothetical protein
MELSTIYSENLLYPHRITRVVAQAGLLEEEQEASFEEYIRASSQLTRW